MAVVEAIVATFALLLLLFSWFISKTKRSLVVDWPVLGMLPSLLLIPSQFHDYSVDVLEQFNHTFEVKGPRFLKMNFTATSDPDNIRHIFSTHFANFEKGRAFKEIFEILGDGILAAESDSWKMQRKLTHSLFRQKEFIKVVETSCQQKVEMGLFKILDHAADNGLQVDLQDLFQRFAVDVTCKFVLGSDLNSLSVDLPEVPFAVAVDNLAEILFRRHLLPRSFWKLQKWLQVGSEKKATEYMKIIDSFIYQQISLKQELHRKGTATTGREAVEEEGFDLVSNFMMNEVAGKSQTSDLPKETFLRDMVFSILFAGKDSTSIALTWFCWLVSINPQVESKLREEIRVTCQMKEGDPWTFSSNQELSHLIYLHATLCETLRLYPPLPFNHKSSIEPDILPSGHRVEKETEILSSMYAMARMEKIWGADCREFKPERWISEKGSIIDVPSYKYNVFSSGPRICVGKDLAFKEMKIVAAAIVWSYRIQVVQDHPISLANHIMLHMQHGLKVNVTKRCKL